LNRGKSTKETICIDKTTAVKF